MGEKTIGVAVSDALGWTAQGLEVIRRTNKKNDLKRIGEIIHEYEVQGIVVGLPKNMDNTLGPRAQASLEFADELRAKFHLPVHLWDERLTTVTAERTLLEADLSRKKRKAVVDKMAAQIILQGFLNSRTKG